MPIKNGIGYSKYTQDKQHGLGLLFNYHMSVVERIFPKYRSIPQRYYYLDINAGTGFIEELGCDGSPVIFLKTIRQRNLNGMAWFVESNADNANVLNANLIPIASNVEWNIVNEDNVFAVPRIVQILPYGCYGMLYHDPNNEPNFDLISETFKGPKLNKLDVLIRCPSTTIKRKRCGLPEKYNLTLEEHLATINKKIWLIRRVVKGDAHQWTFFLGTNWADLKDWKKRGFYRLDSAEGRAILYELNYTKTEKMQMGQQTLIQEEET